MALRIAMISALLPSGSKIGVGFQAHALANGLVARGHDVTVFSMFGPSAGALYRTQQVPVEGRLRSFRFATALRNVDFSGFDVLHAHGDDYWLWRRRTGAHVRTMHGSCLSEAMRISGVREKSRMVMLGLSEELASVVADRTVVVSPPTRRWMPWVHTVVPNGVDQSVFRPGGPRSVNPSILFVGTYERRKRGRLLMDAFAREVLPRVPDAELWMVSDDAPAAAGVVQMGRVSEERLVELYQQSWVFCLPSSYEGFGIPYAEAISCGTPAVATRNPGARYVLDEGRSGVLVEPAGLGGALVALLQDDDERARLGAASIERARTFSMERVLDRYEEIYADLLKDARPS